MSQPVPAFATDRRAYWLDYFEAACLRCAAAERKRLLDSVATTPTEGRGWHISRKDKWRKRQRKK